MIEEIYKKIYSNTENLTSREIANRYEKFMGIPITIASIRDYMRKHNIKYKKQTHKGAQKNDRSCINYSCSCSSDAYRTKN